MWESADTTGSNLAGFTSQLSFYEYPSHKPFVNSNRPLHQPSTTLLRTAALPESNRDHLLTALESLSVRIKKLENEHQEAQSNLRRITGEISSHRPGDPSNNQRFDSDEIRGRDRSIEHLNRNDRPKRIRSSRKKKRTSTKLDPMETATIIHSDGRHYHLDINSVPFILGASTAPSHNVKSNVQNVIALLKNHNHQLCLTSKEYSELLNPHLRGDVSPHTLLYLDHYNKSSIRSSSASPVRRRRCSRPTSLRRPFSATRRPSTANFNDQKISSRIEKLRHEYEKLARERQRLTTLGTNQRELEIISQRMEIILQELQRFQRQLKTSMENGTSRERMKSELDQTPLETLRKTRLLQMILRDSQSNDPFQPRRRRRPFSNE